MEINISYAPKDIGLVFRAIDDDLLKDVINYGYTKDDLYVMQVDYIKDRPYIDFYDEYNDIDYSLYLGKIYTDLASIPKIPVVYGALKLKQPIPSIFHDGGYGVNTPADNSDCYWTKDNIKQTGRMPFELCNSMYRALMLYYNVSTGIATAEYLALEMFGKTSYDDCDK